MKNHFLLITSFSLVLLVSCAEKKENHSAESPLKPVATIQEIMQSVVDPNIDPIWESVQTVSSSAGIVEQHPKTDEEWAVLKSHALTLVEVPNLLLIEGRKVATSNTSSVAAELKPEEIEKLIQQNRSEFIANAHGLQNSALKLVAAIDARDPIALEAAGGEVDQVCEKCHKKFWYPGDKTPIQ